jgi:hypothetical protein
MRHVSFTSTHVHRSAGSIAAALMLWLTLATATPVAAVRPVPAADPAVITTWNQIAVSTITAGAPGPTAFNYFAFVHLAMYNAVVGITGEYELYRWDKHAPTNASPEAAAAAAAHRVLVTYFPAAAATLDTHLASSLALVPDGGPQDKGISYGVRAADRIIALRASDGRNAPVTVPVGTNPGHWRPEPTTALFGTAWMGGVTPLAIESATQFAPGPPPAIGSATYLEEFDEVRDYGGQNSDTMRTADQTLTARFYSDTAIGPIQTGLRDLATRRALNISDSARMFAAVETAIADAVITAWYGKLQYMWWRPITAIRNADTDGDDDTAGVPGWTPLIGTPPYPEWPSGLCAVIGALGTVLTRLNDDEKVDLWIASAAAGESRYFATKAQMAQEAVDARVWSGIHFRTADEVSIVIGTAVAEYTLDHYFQPTD